MPPATKPPVETPAANAAAHDAAKEAAPAGNAAQELSIESIGWLFLQKYYGSYTADKSKLYAFYDADASVSHEELSESGEAPENAPRIAKTVHVAQGSEAVRAFYEGSAASSGAAKNKIVVESATFQKSVDSSILIVVSGSWKRGSSQLWQFVQTFVLRAKGKTVYDIANDVLKFVDLAAPHQAAATPVHVTKPTEKVEDEEPAAESSAGIAEAGVKASEEPAGETEAEKDETIEPQVEESAVSEATEEPKNEEQETAETTPAASEPEKAPESENATPAAPAHKPTWATLAAIGPKTAPKSATVAAPIATKSTVPAAVSPASAAKTAVSPAQNGSPSAANGKYKKEEWYPIYIKNVEVEDDELKAALIKQFGDIKFFKRTNKTALCDFRSKDDQQKALETKELVVKSNVILLEPRVHKTFSKPDAKKDKKQVKKNGFKKN